MEAEKSHYLRFAKFLLMFLSYMITLVGALIL